MVEAISHVGRTLGIATIAEKVESAAVFAELKRLRVQFAQGYYIAKPAPIELLRPGMPLPVLELALEKAPGAEQQLRIG
jgi:EAL domain-containing protein (putative c-di-GMP-specific phosphodiesterase class I)